MRKLNAPFDCLPLPASLTEYLFFFFFFFSTHSVNSLRWHETCCKTTDQLTVTLFFPLGWHPKVASWHFCILQDVRSLISHFFVYFFSLFLHFHDTTILNIRALDTPCVWVMLLMLCQCHVSPWDARSTLIASSSFMYTGLHLILSCQPCILDKLTVK